MGKIAAAILGAIIGGFTAVAAVIFWFGWGLPGQGQAPYIEPERGDYVDLLLTVVTVFLGAIGLGVTVGAVVIGLVALKTLREIKDEAASKAKVVAAEKIAETMETELGPHVNARVSIALPEAIKIALVNDELGHKILSKMARRGDLDEVFERVAMRIQMGGSEYPDGDSADEDATA